MKRFLKWLGWLFVGFAIILLGLFAVAYYYKKEIIATVKEELKKNINGDIDFKDITFSVLEEFPAVSVTLHDFYIRGPHYDQYSHDFLNASKVYVQVQLEPLLKKKILIESIRITQGEIYVFRSRTGYSNLDVFKRPKRDTAKSGDPIDISFHNVRLEEMGLFYRDSLKNKIVGLRCINVYNEITETDSSLRFMITGPVRFEGMALNPPQGSYLKDKEATVSWDLESVNGEKRLVIHPSSMVFEKSIVKLDGWFAFAGVGNFQLNISADNLNYAEGLSIVAQSLQSKLSRYDVGRPLGLKVKLRGLLSAGNPPAVDVSFDIKDSPVRVSTKEFSRVTVLGEFSNHFDSTRHFDDANSMVLLKSISTTYRGLPMHARARFLGLDDPHIDITLSIDSDLKRLNTMEDSTELKISGGRFRSRFDYSGKLRELNDSTATAYAGKLSGFVQVQDGAFKYLPRSYDFKSVNVAIHFDQTHVTLDSLSLLLNQSPVFIKGEIAGFVPFFVQPREKGSVKIKVFSPSFNLTPLLTKSQSSPAKDEKKASPSFIATLYNKVQFDMDIQVTKFVYKRLTGYNLNGKVGLINRNLTARNFSMKVAGGDVSFSGNLNPLFTSSSGMFFKSKVRNADLKQFFYAFDNFKMTSLTYDNLEGKIDVDASFSAWVDDEFAVQVPSIKSTVDLTLKQGRIVNFEPLSNMSNFLMKNRDFSDVHFGEIKSKLTVRGTEIDIQRMEIEASVLRLFLQGRYSLKDSTDLSVQLPLSNLKKRDKMDKLENVGTDAKVGMSIFLHVYQDEGKMVIAYDPFKKHHKKYAEAAKNK